MNKYSLLIVISILSFSWLSAFPQRDSTQRSFWFSVGGGGGIYSYMGDLQNSTSINLHSQIKPGYHLNIEQILFNSLGLMMDHSSGTLEYSKRRIGENLNFQSKIKSTALLLNFYFNSTKNSYSNLFSPYLGIGIGSFSFDPFGDLKDQSGNNYFYWTDGTIRDREESNENEFIAQEISQDLQYETQLTDATENYKRSSIFVPINMGLKLNLSSSFNTRVGMRYNYTATDFIDNIKSGNNTDKFLYTYVSFNYNFGFVKSKKSADLEVDFSNIENQDEDRDGIPDMKDDCPQSPPDIKVDLRGCPIDIDKDGVPDFKDKEIKLVKGAIVDSEGVILTENAITEKFAKDSIIDYLITIEKIEVRDTLSYSHNLLEKTIMIEKDKIKLTEKYVLQEIPSELIVADFNKDGQIKADEIMLAIDAFFDGEKEITVDIINRLIDYFFNQ